jgi:hypothetical protein
MRQALRVLRLLEEQHQRLARIIQTQGVIDVADPAASLPHGDQTPETGGKSKSKASPAEARDSSKTRTSSSSLATAKAGSQIRDSSPSLAREMASRRGIPPTGRSQPSAAAQARARQLSPESRRSSRNVHPAPKVPPSIMDSQASFRPKKTKKEEEDEGFTKFYSELTTGTMSKLSSVLAYAGLPLRPEDVRLNASELSPRDTVRANHDPNVNKFFSKAALEAVEDEHRQRGTLGAAFAPTESFYVVPATGMTKSFAQMAARNLDKLGEDDEDDFVDAKEAQGDSSPNQSRAGQKAAAHPYDKTATKEELKLQNETMKQTIDELANRLRQFELHAQDASMAALTQSVASIHPGPSSNAAMLERIQQLEQQVEREAEKAQSYETRCAKQEKQMKQWKSYYDNLKDRAKQKARAKEAAGKAVDKAAEEEATVEEAVADAEEPLVTPT